GDPATGHSFWVRFLLSWLASSGLGTLLLFLFHYLYLTPPLPDGYAAVYYALRHLGNTMLPVVALSFLAYVLFLGGAAAWLCINLLHKVAGPIFGLEKVFVTYLNGGSVRPFFLRHGDLVPDLTSSFNGFVGRLREDRQKWLGLMENADRLWLQDRETCRAEMGKALAELETLLSPYR
ncbi:MAG: hypothetical protein R3239_04610, partial [Thermodesulfobacteriota bacterium]|nr:hypothetical protein [Thermodesulfobacteriota bacterium]